MGITDKIDISSGNVVETDTYIKDSDGNQQHVIRMLKGRTLITVNAILNDPYIESVEIIIQGEKTNRIRRDWISVERFRQDNPDIIV